VKIRKELFGEKIFVDVELVGIYKNRKKFIFFEKCEVWWGLKLKKPALDARWVT